MKGKNLFVLMSIMENALMGHWSFQAENELAVARHLCQNAWRYPDVFWALRLSRKEVDRIRPDELLQAIRGSYPNTHVRAVLYLLRIASPADCAETDRVETLPGGAAAH